MKEFLPHRSQIVFALSLGFVFGVGVGLFEGAYFLHIVFSVLLFCFVFVVMGFRHWQVWTIVFFSVGLLVGALFAQDRLLLHDGYMLAGQSISGDGLVSREPRQSERFLNTEVTLASEGLTVLVRAPKHEVIVYGDQVDVRCVLEAPEAFEGFNYPRYLQMRGIDYICDEGAISVVGASSHTLSRIAAARREMERGINQLIKHPEAGLANGLLFGGDDRLSEDLQDAFSRTGMSHIVAVSGYNVTVIVLVVIGLAIRIGFWRKQAAVIALIAVLLFVAMIGFPSSGVRAALMGTLVLFAVMFGRASHALGAITLAGALMLLWNPLQLFYDVGFQLSFGAVLGIMAFFPLFEKYVIRSRRSMGILDILFLTISAQVFVLPIILYHFGIFSTTSLLTNLLVLPILPYTMFFVFMAAVFGVLFAPLDLLAIPFAMLAQWLLTYEILVIEYFAAQSYSVVTVENFPLWIGCMYYGILLLVIYFSSRKNAYERY